MKDLMIDIETMGRPPNGAIIAIGAVVFDLATGKTGNNFRATIDLEDAVNNHKMELDPGTVLWWFSQSKEAIDTWRNAPKCVLKEAMTYLRMFCVDNEVSNIWANAPTFDLDILRSAFKATDVEVPWSYRDERCVRTLVRLASMAGAPRSNTAFKGVQHDALADCIHQINYCHEAWNALRGENVNK